MTGVIKKKIVIIGDGYIGKTCILHAINDGDFSERAPNILEEFVVTKQSHGKTFQLQFVDTPGQEEYDAIRQLTYNKVDVFLVCFSVADLISFENVKSKWLPDIKDYVDVPKIFVGSKLDLKFKSEDGYVSKAAVKLLQKKMQGVPYVECSAKTNEGIEQLLKVIISILEGETKRSCTIQ